MSMPSVGPRAVVAAIAIGAIALASAFGSAGALLGVAESVAADPLLFGLVVAVLYLVRPVLGLPPTALAVLVGYGYGVALGIPVALVGVVTTVIPVFLVVRWFSDGGPATAHGRSSLPAPFGALLERARTVVTRYYESAGPIRGVVASRLAPIPSDVSTCAAAVSGIRLGQLVIGTAIGELPWTVAAVVVGASTATVRTNGLGELGITLTVACLVAAVALLSAPLYRAVRTRTQKGTAGRTADS